MLRIITKMAELSLPALMPVYEQSNLANASDNWPDLPNGFALQLAEQEFGQYLREVFFKTPGAFCAVWEEEGKYVSALRLEPFRDGMLLEALETAPAERRKGYAVKLVRSVLAFMGDMKVYSHVGKRNAASLAVHKHCGFRVLQDHAAYIDGSVDRRCCTLCYQKSME